jgi:hypothetical protein
MTQDGFIHVVARIVARIAEEFSTVDATRTLAETGR